MYDGNKIIPGLVVFVGLLTSPAWYDAVTGKLAATAPEPIVAEGKGDCVEAPDWMRANHMVFLHDWREEVVRRGQRTYVAGDGREFDKSLTGTCLDCHSTAKQTDKTEFCVKCHDYADVSVDCWDCHLPPEER
jgi:hypothetical protein